MNHKVSKIFRKVPSKIFLYIGANQDNLSGFQTQISKGLNLPNTTVNYWITKFKATGLIYKDLRLTEKGQNLFRTIWLDKAFSKGFRAHNIQITFNVISCPDNFPECYSRNPICRPLKNSKYNGIKTNIMGTTVLFYSRRKLVCVIPDIYAGSEEDISSVIQLECLELKEILENELGIKINDYEIASLTRMHVAILNSIIAESVIIKKGNYKSELIHIDQSKGVPEIECVNPLTALNDIQIIKEVEDILKETKKDALKPISENKPNQEQGKNS